MTQEEIEKLADKWYNKHGSISPSVIEKTAFIVGYKAAYQETERLKAELNELKERHKKNVESAFRDGLYRPKLYMNNAELYYKQKFESND